MTTGVGASMKKGGESLFLPGGEPEGPAVPHPVSPFVQSVRLSASLCLRSRVRPPQLIPSDAQTDAVPPSEALKLSVCAFAAAGGSGFSQSHRTMCG